MDSTPGRGTEVLVLGGGPAGLTAARECAARGLRTLLVERKREIGCPVQTSGATWVPDMKRHGVPSSLFHRVESLRFLSPGEEAAFRNTDSGLVVLDVRGAFQHLAERAVACGASLRVGSRVEEPLVEDGGVCGAVVRTPRGTRERIRAAVTIDATGFASVTARRVFGFPGFRRYGLGLEYDLYAKGWPPGEFVLLVGVREAPTGYAWIFPWGGGRVRVGVGITVPEARGTDLEACLRVLLEGDPRFSERFEGAGPIERHRGLIPDEPVPFEGAARGLLVVGDAAGQTSALAGEGIRFAMDMGLEAAKAVAAALGKGGASKEALLAAHRAWGRRHGRNARIAMELNRRMAGFSDAQWDKAVGYLRRLSDAQFLQFLRGDFSLGLFLRILSRNPDLARRALVRRVLKELS